MEFARREAPYSNPTADVPVMMLHVLAALVPAALAHIWFFGPGFLFNFIIAAVVCLGSEALMVQARGRRPEPALTDYTALVTAALIAFALPSLTPWWVTTIASLFAIVVAKHLYGGIGYNVFNPAMVNDEGTFEAPNQFPRGIFHVLVNGGFAVRNGQLMPQRHGELLTRPGT